MSRTLNLRTTACVMNAADNIGYLDIYGRIGKDWMGEGIDAKDIKDALDELGDVDRLEIRIHSAGGFVDEGQAIITALRRFKAEKHVFVDGQAASMASVILQVGDFRYCAKNASIFIHDPIGMCWGSLKTMKRYADDMVQIKEQILDAYMERSTLSREEVSDMMETETRMTAEQALKWGFVDEIGDEITANPEDHASNYDDFFKIAADANFSKLAPHLALKSMSGNPEPKGVTPMAKQTGQDPKAPENTPDPKQTAAPAEPAAQPPTGPSAEEIRAAEKQRIADINAMRQPGVEDLCDQFIEDDTSAGDAALAINKKLAENHKNGQDELEKRRAQGNAIVTDDNADGAEGEVPVDDEDAFDKKCERDWSNNVGNCRDTFMSKEGFKAYQKQNAKGLVKVLSRDTKAA